MGLKSKNGRIGIEDWKDCIIAGLWKKEKSALARLASLPLLPTMRG